MTHQIGSETHGYVDKRRYVALTRSSKDDFESRVVGGAVAFTCNATGTTTTAVGANAAPATDTNCIRIGDEFKLFTAAGVVKEETVFRVTAIAVAASTTLTFTPAAATAPVSTDTLREVGLGYSSGEKDRRLLALGVAQTRINAMTENDKDYQLRISDDPGSLP